jgi:hypothetical protein
MPKALTLPSGYLPLKSIIIIRIFFYDDAPRKYNFALKKGKFYSSFDFRLPELQGYVWTILASSCYWHVWTSI